MKNYIRNIELQVSDISRSIDFYTDKIGFNYEQINDSACLFTSDKINYLIKLTENKNSTNVVRNETGLFHIAIKLPDRKALAETFYSLYSKGVKFEGFSDHLVSEAIYLTDPDGNGIELYSDKKQEEWNWNDGEVEMSTLPLNLNELVKEIHDKEISDNLNEKTIIGHLHLKVSNLIKASSFYKGILGMDITSRSYNGALFFSWDKYHHHIGTNIWSSSDGNPRSENAAGLVSFEIEIPDYIKKDELTEKLSKNNLILENKPEFVLVNDFDYNKIKLI